MGTRIITRFLPVLTLIIASVGYGAESWTIRSSNGINIAITPIHQLEVQMMDRPNESIWGKLEIPITAEQLPGLHKHRKSPNFPFINVAIDVDRYYRTAQGHIHDERLMITVDLDLRQWEGLKKGSQLIIGLPDGTELKESLKGSLKVLRNAEVRP